ncbi:uncharacterized protein ATC70_005418 [Mucor velutinosus]|uniref:Uncharacterized protein n=1 Tax=Mucor velutinosus TaxID=708070 RepID=A0AAN7DAV6_9FUNG|nr:hypothetical protein ATC70_005418 [Mucor velutinosus]
MLRVSSILYLQQVWSRPSTLVIVEVAKPIAPIISASEEEEREEEATQDSASTLTEQAAIVIEQEQDKVIGTIQEQDRVSDIIQEQGEDQVQGEDQEQPEIEQEQIFVAASRTVSFKEGSICSSLKISAPSVVVTNGSETVAIIQQQPPPSPTLPRVLPQKPVEREYYDDDLDLDDEDEEEINTPPSTPSSKFSPKRMLHRARSSINDESVRNLGRRTSMFLEKFNYQPTLPATPNLRRQSSKLTNKGKTLSTKLKRVLSFHHTN